MLLDNAGNGHVGTWLKQNNFSHGKLSVLSSLFTIYGYESLKKELNQVSSAKLYITNWQNISTQNLIGNDDETALISQLNQKFVAKEFASWLEQKAEVKASNHPQAIHNLIHLEPNGDEKCAIQGNATLSPSGLGDVHASGLQMNTAFSDVENTQQLLNWFNTIWADKSSAQSIKTDLLSRLEFIAADQPANLIYYITLFNIFKDFLEEIDEDKIIKSKTGFKETVVWNKLYKFQKDGVVGAIDKLEKHNGCIIADSVGLGKTFEALAVIKYYELRNDRVLVLCPKKLRENWTIFTVNDKRNLFASDRFAYDVLNHTDLSRTKGLSGEINLETLNWENYDLIVIDESHNFRNNPNKAEGKTRYKRLLDDLIRSGVKTKVLMLSATPVSNRLNDLKNQVAFITEGKDDAFKQFGLKSIDNTLRLAQTQFNKWSQSPSEKRTTDSLLERLNFGYFKLLDIATIARSRKHIEKYYGTEEIGTFPTRLAPKNIYADIDLSGCFPPLSEVNKTIRRLSLAGYSPLKFLRNDKKEEYARRYDKTLEGGKGVFKQIDREESLVHLMRVNLLKRMESSIHSFTLTSSKLLAQVETLLAKIAKHRASDVFELNIEEIEDVELNAPELEPFLLGNKTKVLIQDMDLIRFKQELEADRILLQQIVQNAKRVNATLDAKLEQIKTAIEHKANSPINNDNKKVIVFTAFADTAQYLYQHLAEWAQDELNVSSALVTGAGNNKTNYQENPDSSKRQSTELNSLLTNFSPNSKERYKIAPDAEGEIDLLIATDCISEGQNLQDCDTLINYDIHWNPVRIIQRFGRIDRLGSKNTQIQLINFWPNIELDEYINLEARVSGRMVLLDISATGEENLIESNQGDPNSPEMNDLEYRRKQLQQLKDSVVDLEDIAGGISITDLTLTDFRMDLSEYMNSSAPPPLDTDNDLTNQQTKQEFLKSIPNGLHSVVSLDKTAIRDGIKPGVIFCLKSLDHTDKKLTREDSSALEPYYLVYVSQDAELELSFSQSKKVLDLLKHQALLNQDPNNNAIKQFNQNTANGKNLSHYQSLLATAIDSIAGKNEEKGVESLFSKGGTVLTNTSSQGIEDFSVVAYLILTDHANHE